MVGQQVIWFLAGKHLDMGKESQISWNKALKEVLGRSTWQLALGSVQTFSFGRQAGLSCCHGGGEGGQGAHMGGGVRVSRLQRTSGHHPLMVRLQDFSIMVWKYLVIAHLQWSMFIKEGKRSWKKSFVFSNALPKTWASLSSPPYGGGVWKQEGRIKFSSAGRQDKVFFCWSWQNCRTVVWLYLATSHQWGVKNCIHMLTWKY